MTTSFCWQTLLAQDARWETYDRGEIIVEQGSYAREILILTRGTVREYSAFLTRNILKTHPSRLAWRRNRGGEEFQ